MKINSIEESIKNKGVQYGRPIVQLDVNPIEGIDRDIDKIISLLNKNDHLYDYLFVTGNALLFREEIKELSRRLTYLIEIETDGTISPKNIAELTNVSFCVILDKEKLKKFDSFIKDYKILAEYKRAYFLYDINSKNELSQIQRDEEKYHLYPIYITFDNNIKDRDIIIKLSNRNGWFVTPKLKYKD